MANAFTKEVVRSITQSAGRFAAIAIIALLGAGVYAGLRMAAPDMRIAGDEFFDGAKLYDISVTTDLGIDDESLEILRGVEGVGEVMPAYQVDAMVLADTSSYVARVESLPVDMAKQSDTSDGVHAVYDGEGYLNRPLLMEGAWPSSDGECVVGIDAARELGIAIGDSLVLEKATSKLDDTFAVTEYEVVGLVNSAEYASSSQLGTTTLGTGLLEMYLFVPTTSFKDDYPYTFAYLTVPDARDKQWDSAAYDEAVGAVKERVSAKATEIADARWKAVKAEAQAELDDARADYESEKADAEAELADAKKKLDDARSQLDSSQGDLATAKVQLDSAYADLEAARKQLVDSRAQLDGARAQLLETYEMLQQMKQLIDAGMADEQTQMQYSYALAGYEKGSAEYAQGEAAYAAGLEQYNQGVAEYEKGRAQYESGVQQYESGKSDFEQGTSDYESGRKEADEEFADAEAELADAQQDIDDIEKPEAYVMDRSKNYGAAQLSSDADGITQIATFLPFMFFLVAALVTLTSMTRMVDEERLNIGTHKALGYSRARITSKYLIYGVLASGVGAVAGIVLLGKLLPWFILTSYAISYAIPVFPVPLEPASTAKALGLSLGVTIVATWGAAAASLRERPAALMLPRVPKAGKRIFLERIRPLWSRMSFSHKVTARNLLRYKRRFFMAVVGIAGCTALLMVGFGLRDAIGGIVSNQYEVLVGYDAAVRVDEDISEENRRLMDDSLESDDVASWLAVSDFNMIAEGADEDLRIEVVVPQQVDELPGFVLLRDRASQTALPMDDEHIILTEKAARVLGVSVGDDVVLFDENAVGDKEGSGRHFVLGGIAENYLGHFAYLTPGAYRAAFGEDPAFDMAYVALQPDADAAAFSDGLLSIDGVNTVSFVAEKIVTYEGMLDVMNKLIFVIVLLAAALAFVVLYNLTNINITERVREIATLKVLGFTRGEVSAYIFREIIVMALIGALLGCALGVPLTFYIAEAAETPQMMFGRTIELASYVLSFVITMAFSAIVAFTMRRKLSRVNMVESLKSVE